MIIYHCYVISSLLLCVSDNSIPFFAERISTNLGTIAVIPASTNVPIANFTFELSLALNEIGMLCMFLCFPQISYFI